jgi:pimeloyl-ACP methyl ester carboxylesterase
LGVSGLVMLLAAGLAILWVVAVASTAWMLSHPPRRTYASAVARGRPGDPGELGRRFTSWVFHSRGLGLPIWDVPGDAPDGPIIVLTHGWGDSRIGGLSRMPALLPLASRLVLWELPGHGAAPGWCRLGTAEVDDLRGLIGAVSEQAAGCGKQPVVLYGWSLGAGVSIVAGCGDSRVAAVIAESPYRLAATPARNVLRARGLPHSMTLKPALVLLAAAVRNGTNFSPDRFDRAAHAARLRCPLLVLHGQDDAVCPVEDGRAVARASPLGQIMEVAGAGHNDLWTEPLAAAECRRTVEGFLSTALGLTARSSADR